MRKSHSKRNCTEVVLDGLGDFGDEANCGLWRAAYAASPSRRPWARLVFCAAGKRMSVGRPLAVIIEDDAAAADALALLLRDFGADTAHGLSLSDLRAAIGRRAADIRWIITDFDIGAAETGVSLAARLTPLAPAARVLVLSADSDGGAAAAARAAGFDVMAKPADAEAIASWLERR